MGVGEPDSVPAQRQPPSIFAGHDVFNLSNRKFRRWLLPPNENAIALTIQCWMMRLVEGYKRQSRPTEVLQPQNGLKGSWMPRLSRFIGSATTNNVGLEIGLGMVAFLTGGPIIAQLKFVGRDVCRRDPDRRQLVLPVATTIFAGRYGVIIRYGGTVDYRPTNQAIEAETYGRQDTGNGSGQGWDERAFSAQVAEWAIAVAGETGASVAHSAGSLRRGVGG